MLLTPIFSSSYIVSIGIPLDWTPPRASYRSPSCACVYAQGQLSSCLSATMATKAFFALMTSACVASC
eukprot:10817004-Heterocapsa_arctica.AAC.1